MSTPDARRFTASSTAGWDAWVRSNVRRRYRHAALEAALDAAARGASPDDVALVAKDVAREAKRAYQARSALAIGAITLVVALLFGGLTILGLVFALASGIPGRRSATRGMEALVGVGLAVAGVAVFAVRTFKLV